MENNYDQILNKSLSFLRYLLSNNSSTSWQSILLPLTNDEIHVYKRTFNSSDIYKSYYKTNKDLQLNYLDLSNALFNNEFLSSFNPLIHSSQTLDIIDSQTKLVSIQFNLGWPKSPRQANLIQSTFHNDHSIISLATSIDSNHPIQQPYVKSNIPLLAWCILLPTENSPYYQFFHFWQWNLKSWSNINSLSSNAPTYTLNLLNNSLDLSNKNPLLTDLQNISIKNYTFNTNRNSLDFNFSISTDDFENSPYLLLSISTSNSWDLHLNVDHNLIIHKFFISSKSYLLVHISFDHHINNAHLLIERSSGTPGTIRINGNITDSIESNDLAHLVDNSTPASAANKFHAKIILQDFPNSSIASLNHSNSSKNSNHNASFDRTPNQANEIASLIRRNYIYFSSLLQEPEAKWKNVTEARGVSISQLDSIDPTLFVYRAQAIFVGVNIFDIFAVIQSHGTRLIWDKGYEDANLLEDLNNSSNIWHFKSKSNWPTSARDYVLVSTSYKSVTAIHTFAFSTNDKNLFPFIPNVENNFIRAQIDLLGIAIEALSPTTVQVTVLEQSDPKGWSNKNTLPQFMINHLAGIGDYAIKYGGPPILTQLSNARATESKFDHEKGTFKLEYEFINPLDTLVPVQSSSKSTTSNKFHPNANLNKTDDNFTISCQIRCDLDIWSSSLDIVIDPPPISIKCLKRHRLSALGGGLWIKIKHKHINLVSDSKLTCIIRQCNKKSERGIVYVNGSKVDVEVEDINESDIQKLKGMKRRKPNRTPLDQLNEKQSDKVIDAVDGWNLLEIDEPSTPSTNLEVATPNRSGIFSKYASPLSKLVGTSNPSSPHSLDNKSLQQNPIDVIKIDENSQHKPKQPMRKALDSLSWTRRLCDDLRSFQKGLSLSEDVHKSSSNRNDWSIISEKDDMITYKKHFHALSNDVPVQVSQKIIQGFSAEEISAAIYTPKLKTKWDDKITSDINLQKFSDGCFSNFTCLKSTFPFKDRAFLTATISTTTTNMVNNNINDDNDLNFRKKFIISTSSFDNSLLSNTFNLNKLNSNNSPFGRIIIDSWVIEEIDPYSSETLLIPSSKVSRYVAVDFGGNIPNAVNGMCNNLMTKSVMLLNDYLKTFGPPPLILNPNSTLSFNCESEIPDEASLKNGELNWILLSPFEAYNKDFEKNLISFEYNNDLKYYSKFSLGFLNENERSKRNGVNNMNVLNENKNAESVEDNVNDQQQQLSPTLLISDSNPSVLAKRASSMSMKVNPKLVYGNTRRTSSSIQTFNTQQNLTDNLKYSLDNLQDFIIGEITLDLQSFPNGYIVNHSCYWTNKQYGELEMDDEFFNDERDTSIPIEILVYNLNSSLDHARTRRKQVVRVILKSSLLEVNQETIEDEFDENERKLDQIGLGLGIPSTASTTNKKVIKKLKFDEGKKMIINLSIERNEDGNNVEEFILNNQTKSIESEKLTMQDIFENSKPYVLDCVSLASTFFQKSSIIPSSIPISTNEKAIPPALLNPVSNATQFLISEKDNVITDSDNEIQSTENVEDDGEVKPSSSFLSFWNKNSFDIFNFASPSIFSKSDKFDNHLSEDQKSTKIDIDNLGTKSPSEISSPSDGYRTPQQAQSPVPKVSPKAKNNEEIENKVEEVGEYNAIETKQMNGRNGNRSTASIGIIIFLTAITFFLLGSFVRSLMIPSDYIVYINSDQLSIPNNLNQIINYKIVKSMFSFKFPRFNWNLIIAFTSNSD